MVAIGYPPIVGGGGIPATIFDAKGDLLGATGPDSPARVPVGPDGYVLTGDSVDPLGVSWQPPGGSGFTPTVRDGYVTSGDVLAPNTGANWVPLGSEYVLPSVVGNRVEFQLSAMFDFNVAFFLDLAVLMGPGPSIARRSSTGTSSATTANEGDPSMYSSWNGFARVGGGFFSFTVQAGDLDGGNVRFSVITRSNGTGKMFQSTNYPLRWRAIDLGPVN